MHLPLQQSTQLEKVMNLGQLAHTGGYSLPLLKSAVCPKSLARFQNGISNKVLFCRRRSRGKLYLRAINMRIWWMRNLIRGNIQGGEIIYRESTATRDLGEERTDPTESVNMNCNFPI